MKKPEVLEVSQEGTSTLPKWWREAVGIAKGGKVEVRAGEDGSLILRPFRTKGVSGKTILDLFSRCPYPIELPERC